MINFYHTLSLLFIKTELHRDTKYHWTRLPAHITVTKLLSFKLTMNSKQLRFPPVAKSLTEHQINLANEESVAEKASPF